MKVRTTMQPWREVEVTPQEYTDLKIQGVLIEGSESKSDEVVSSTRVSGEGRES